MADVTVVGICGSLREESVTRVALERALEAADRSGQTPNCSISGSTTFRRSIRIASATRPATRKRSPPGCGLPTR